MLTLIILTHYSKHRITSRSTSQRMGSDFCSSSQNIFSSKESENQSQVRTETQP